MLVVEDEPFIAMVIEEVIDAIGAEILGPFAYLEEALTAARGEQFDCAVLDVNICGEYVFPVADVLIDRAIPFLLATGYAAATLPAHLVSGSRLTKPYTAAQLEGDLKRLCSQVF